MEEYLKLFTNHADYQTYINGADAILPNVSYCVDAKDVHYNPKPKYTKMYLTFECLGNGTITVISTNSSNVKTFSYSVDDGENWTSITTSTSQQSLGDFVTGDKIIFKGNNIAYATNYYFTEFGGTAQFKVYGNIMSLVYGDNFGSQTTFTDEYKFGMMFYNNDNIISAKNLILPATTLAERCYYMMFWGCENLVDAPELPATTLANDCYNNMFYGCTSLTKAPELPATTLVSRCYNGMFGGCGNINYIKAMFTTTPGTSYTSSWVSGVSATGTFVKNSSAAWDLSGVSGIPSGWTVQTASS